jgi:hypothetical protein
LGFEFSGQLLAQGPALSRLLLLRFALKQLMLFGPPPFRFALFRLTVFGRSCSIRFQREPLIGCGLGPIFDGLAHGDHVAHQLGKLASAAHDDIAGTLVGFDAANESPQAPYRAQHAPRQEQRQYDAQESHWRDRNDDEIVAARGAFGNVPQHLLPGRGLRIDQVLQFRIDIAGGGARDRSSLCVHACN